MKVSLVERIAQCRRSGCFIARRAQKWRIVAFFEASDGIFGLGVREEL